MFFTLFSLFYILILLLSFPRQNGVRQWCTDRKSGHGCRRRVGAPSPESSPQVYTRIGRAGQISVSQNLLQNSFFFNIKKKITCKKIQITYLKPWYIITLSLNRNCSPQICFTLSVVYTYE